MTSFPVSWLYSNILFVGLFVYAYVCARDAAFIIVPYLFVLLFTFSFFSCQVPVVVESSSYLDPDKKYN